MPLDNPTFLLNTWRRRLHRQSALWLAGVAALTLAWGNAGAQVHVSPKGGATKATAPAAATSASKPAWNELTSSQKAALAPLAPHWSVLSEAHKRKWIALSRNFSEWPADEQARIHGRMSAWAGLSAPERNQARVNFAEARKLDRDEKMARWEAYQALSDEQRDKLAATVVPKRAGVAVAAKPVRSSTMPAGAAPHAQPRVGLPSSGVDHNTLLPQLPAP